MKSEYINCKNCKDDCHCRGKDLTPICIAFKPVKTTNADRIRAMTDEELAKTEMLCPYWASKEWSCPQKYAKRKDGKKGYDCVACVLDWLKSPVEVQDEP